MDDSLEVKCPYCGRALTIKTIEAYKEFWICSNSDCRVMSVIFTTTTKNILS
jgi:ssDNA-binding Zn-finger/Zn-ribbon topoisomerase 1